MPDFPWSDAVNYPLAYFAERIGSDLIDLQFLPGTSDGDPAFWEPGDADVAAMQKADLILVNGATYAKWQEKVSLPESILVDTSKDFAGEFIKTESNVTHRHGMDGEHSHAGTAFTTWMDFQQAIWQAEAVRDALIELLPENRGEFRGAIRGTRLRLGSPPCGVQERWSQTRRTAFCRLPSGLPVLRSPLSAGDPIRPLGTGNRAG